MKAEITVRNGSEIGTTAPSYQDLLSAFLSGKSPRTITAYSQDLESFRRFLGADDLEDVSRRFLGHGPGQANLTAMQFKSDLMAKGLAPSTVNRRLAALRSLAALGRTLGLIGWKLEVRNVKSESYRDTRGPGIVGVKGMLNLTTSRADAKGARDHAIIRTLYDLGLRRGEATALNLEDLDLKARTLWVMGKGRTEKTALTIPEKTSEALASWLGHRGIAPGPLFLNLDHAQKGDGRLSGRSVHRIVQGLGDQVGVKARPHGIRHTAITQAVRLAQSAGMGLESAQDFSRHSDIKTLMIYCDREKDNQGTLADLVSQAV